MTDEICRRAGVLANDLPRYGLALSGRDAPVPVRAAARAVDLKPRRRETRLTQPAQPGLTSNRA